MSGCLLFGQIQSQQSLMLHYKIYFCKGFKMEIVFSNSITLSSFFFSRIFLKKELPLINSLVQMVWKMQNKCLIFFCSRAFTNLFLSILQVMRQDNFWYYKLLNMFDVFLSHCRYYPQVLFLPNRKPLSYYLSFCDMTHQSFILLKNFIQGSLRGSMG